MVAIPYIGTRRSLQFSNLSSIYMVTHMHNDAPLLRVFANT